MALTQISTKGIKDGTILNEDISGSAAIAASKVSGLATDKISEGNTSVEVIDSQGDNTIGVIKADLGITSNAGQSITESNYFHSTKSGNDYTTEINQAHNGNNNTFKLGVGNTGGTGQFRIEKGSSGGDNAGVLQYATGSSGAGGQWSLSTGGQQNYLTTQTTNIFAKNVVPQTDSQIDLGSNTVRWQNVYADDYYGSGANLTNLPAAQLTGTLPAIDGSNLTGISAGVSVSNNANNRVITGDGTNLVGESALVFDGTKLGIGTHTGLPNTKFDIGLGVHVGTGDDDAADWGANNVFQLTATGGNAANNEVLMVGAHSGGVGQIASGIGFGRESTTNWGTDLRFKTHATSTSNIDNLKERMKIFSDGRVSMTTTDSPQTGASSSANELTISGDSVMGMTLHTNSTTGQCNIYFSDTGSAYPGAISYLHQHNQLRLNVNGNYSAPVMQFNSDLTIYFQNTIYSNGASYSTGSDLRMKSNLVKFTDTLHNLKSINGYKFDITNSTTGQTRKSAGLIAQEVEKIYPDFVVENPETGMKSLEYNTFIGVLVEAIKELTTRVETLETA